ncbi:hypothetical protein CAPTEDRAFT_211754 [Capitella teleta]|uniref:Uncharacterized protein n=1 Tax=Capitella teleta TaxID=283909 RepID=R7T8L7_CAPTE|nr:hypothetical protein CAPTEDRAFT_211754 [Capitella teleta]|eukprot:ELT87735.1 hypothetical protein CAPTEDRAFT_211754 [Capitella teleta]
MSSDEGFCQLQCAIKAEDVPMVNALLCTSNPNGIFHVDKLHTLLAAVCEVTNVEKKQQIVDLLIKHGADVDSVGSDGCTLLPLLAKVEKFVFVTKKFLSKIANPNMKDDCGNVSMVKLFLEYGAEVNAQDIEGSTVLHYVVMDEMDQIAKEKIVELLIENEIDVNIANAGYLRIVKMLIKHNADPNATNDKGNAPLHIAINNNYFSIVDLLKRYGADVTRRNAYCESAKSLLSAKTFLYITHELQVQCISKAIVYGNGESSEEGAQNTKEVILIAFVEMYNSMGTFTNLNELLNITEINFLLTWMAQRCDYTRFNGTCLTTTKLSFLLNQTKDLSQIGYHRRNFLHFLASFFRAIFKNQEAVKVQRIMDILTKRHIDASVLNTKDDNGWTPVHVMFIASTFTFSEEVSRSQCAFFNSRFAPLIADILNEGFNCMEKDNQGASVIHYAAGTRFSQVLQSLLEECTVKFVNKGDRFGSSPLHYAALANNTEATQLLLDKGCNKTKKDCNGRTACELAELLGYGDIVHLLSDRDQLWKSDVFNYRDVHTIDQSEDSIDYVKFTEQLSRQDASEIDAKYTSLLKSPVLGRRKFHEQCFQKEAQLIEDEVVRLIYRFSKRHKRRYPSLNLEPRLRGSIAEGTRCGPPDEFDFLFIMNDCFDDYQVNSIDNCKAYATFRDAIDDLWQLPPNEMIDVLNIALKNVPSTSKGSDVENSTPLVEIILIRMIQFLMTDTAWVGSCLKFFSCDRSAVGLCLNLIFNGHLYKMLHISIDIVPCICLKMPVPVKVSIDWPVPLDFSRCQLFGLFRFSCDGFDISSTEYEEVLLKSLPSAAIDAYVLGKAFGSAQFKWSDKRFAKIFKSSYKMKKALLMSVRLHKNIQEVSRHEWMKGMIDVASNMEKYKKEKDCFRCIFHAQRWHRGAKDNLHLSFS